MRGQAKKTTNTSFTTITHSANRSLTGSTQESIFVNKDGKHLSWIPGRYPWQRRFSEPTRRGVHDRQHIITLSH